MLPHEGQRVAQAGVPIGASPVVVIAVHGRNAAPENILDVARRLGRPDLTYLAPAAAGRTWYPHSFMAEAASNEPALTSAIHVVASLIASVESSGVARARIVLMGFSQGACLVSECAVRHASRFGGVVALSGGVIGPPGAQWDYPGRFGGTPVFLGCSNEDPHVPATRVVESASVFAKMGADVTMRLYPDMGHVVTDDELMFARRVLDLASQ